MPNILPDTYPDHPLWSASREAFNEHYRHRRSSNALSEGVGQDININSLLPDEDEDEDAIEWVKRYFINSACPPRLLRHRVIQLRQKSQLHPNFSSLKTVA